MNRRSMSSRNCCHFNNQIFLYWNGIIVCLKITFTHFLIPFWCSKFFSKIQYGYKGYWLQGGEGIGFIFLGGELIYSTWKRSLFCTKQACTFVLGGSKVTLCWSIKLAHFGFTKEGIQDLNAVSISQLKPVMLWYLYKTKWLDVWLGFLHYNNRS